MPYSSNSELPEAVRSALPSAAQTRFRQVANSTLANGGSESRAFASAWTVVRNGWKKPKGGGKWVRKARTFNEVIQDEFIKTYDVEVAKVDDELGLVFGWAIVSKIQGEDYFDLQGDNIPEESMLKAATEFMVSDRTAKEMHVGESKGQIVFAFPLTTEIAKFFGIETKQTGLMIAMKPDDPKILEKFKDGTYTGFSMGGQRIVDEEIEDGE